MITTFLKLGLFISAIVFLPGCDFAQKKNNGTDALKLVGPEENEYDSTIFEPLFKKLKAGEELSAMEVESFAKDVATRAEFFTLLTAFNKQLLFPKQYYSFEKATESVLAHWLLYPTELDTIPSQIEHVKQVSIAEHDTTFIYYVLRFKTEEPHWAAKDGWMIGVVGPYFKDSKPYDWTTGTFSKFSKEKETTPEKEVEWVHANVFRRSAE